MLTHLPDLESDFSAIHRISIDFEAGEYGGLSSKRFFQMAERLPAYAGVIQARVAAEQQEQQDDGRRPVTDDAISGGDGGPVKVIPLTPEMAAHGMTALGLAGVVDYATG